MLSHFHLGWSPPSLHDEPVIWMPRCNHKVADGLADLTMDLAHSWEKTFKTRLSPSTANVVAQMDGSLRQEGCAAAAWILGFWGVIGGTYIYEPFMAGVTYITTSISAVACEAVALDEAVARVEQLISVNM